MSRRAAVLATLGDAELRALRCQVGEQVRAEIDQILEERGRKKRKRRPAKPPEKEGPAKGYALVVPWDCLASKNLLLKGGGERKPAEMQYRAAIRRTRAEVGRQVPEPHPAYHGPVAAGFVFYPPDDRSDIHNFFDALMDGLEGPLVAKDKLIRCGYWLVGGFDPANPRVEIQVVGRGWIHWIPPTLSVHSTHGG